MQSALHQFTGKDVLVAVAILEYTPNTFDRRGVCTD